MRTSRHVGRMLALLQMLLLSPLMLGGSVCISTEGSRTSEPGPCACVVTPALPDEAASGAALDAGCGPCRDEVLSATRSVPPAPLSPPPALTAVAAGPLAVDAPPGRGRPSDRAGEPPGRRRPILRC